MSDPTKCPECNSENIYSDGNLWICPECSHEWNPHVSTSSTYETSNDGIVKDASGNILADGDSVTVIKDLKVKGSSSVVKVGTKVKNIKLTDGSDGHNIACKIDGFWGYESQIGICSKIISPKLLLENTYGDQSWLLSTSNLAL